MLQSLPPFLIEVGMFSLAALLILRTRAPRRFAQPFRIASITKTFVATAVLQLADRGQLQKTDLLEKWFPDFPNSSKITVDDLLRMRSGIAAQSDEEINDAIYDHPTISAPTLAQQMAEIGQTSGSVQATGSGRCLHQP